MVDPKTADSIRNMYLLLIDIVPPPSSFCFRFLILPLYIRRVSSLILLYYYLDIYVVNSHLVPVFGTLVFILSWLYMFAAS